MTQREELYGLIRSSLLSILPETDILSTRYLDSASWLEVIQEEKSLIEDINLPLLLIVESDTEDSSSAYSGLMHCQVQEVNTKIYLVDKGYGFRSTGFDVGAGAYEISSLVANVGDIVTWETGKGVIQSLTPSFGGFLMEVYPTGVGDIFPVTFTSDLKLNLERKLIALRTALRLNTCEVAGVILQESSHIAIGGGLDLNKVLSGNRSDLWAGMLNLTWDVFYE